MQDWIEDHIHDCEHACTCPLVSVMTVSLNKQITRESNAIHDILDCYAKKDITCRHAQKQGLHPMSRHMHNDCQGNTVFFTGYELLEHSLL